jgi:hypothetical protein
MPTYTDNEGRNVSTSQNSDWTEVLKKPGDRPREPERVPQPERDRPSRDRPADGDRDNREAELPGEGGTYDRD